PHSLAQLEILVHTQFLVAGYKQIPGLLQVLTQGVNIFLLVVLIFHVGTPRAELDGRRLYAERRGIDRDPRTHGRADGRTPHVLALGDRWFGFDDGGDQAGGVL